MAPTSLIPTVGGDEIRHTINRHGKHVDGLTKGETQKNQIPITADDIAKIGEVLESYDSIEKGSPNVRHGVATETVKFKKKCDDGTVYTVFAVPENLQFRTMWKTHTQERQHAGEMCEPLPLRPRLGRVDIADCTTPSV